MDRIQQPKLVLTHKSQVQEGTHTKKRDSTRVMSKNEFDIQ
jgi:hypothetical protein